MDSFQIIQPSTLLAPFVKHYWFMTINSADLATERIIPAGMMCLTFHRGERLFSSADNCLQPRSFLSGIDSSYTDLSFNGCIDLISIDFRPAGAKAFFKMPMIDLNGQNIAIDSFSDPQLVELENRLFDTTNPMDCVSIIENFLYKRLFQLDTYNLKRINAVIKSIYQGQQNIDNLAQTACLGYKQFKRIFADYIGANPKDYLRVIRFQKALHIMKIRPYLGQAQFAYECGYYDQAHFIKEFKLFSGYTPTEYLNICTPHSDFFS